MKTALAPWQGGLGLMPNFRQEIQELMDRFFGDDAGNGQFAQAWTPRVDVEETDKEIVVKADLPGVDPKSVEISVENGFLTVRGEKKEEKEEKKKNYHRVERFAGSFYRAIQLPAGADAEKVAATSGNGVVTVTIPKKPDAQPRKITVTPKA